MDKLISKKQLKDFSLLIGFAFPLFIGVIIPFIQGHSYKIWPLFFSLPIIIIGQTKPLSLKFLYQKWMWLGNTLGWINSHLILGLISISMLSSTSGITKTDAKEV